MNLKESKQSNCLVAMYLYEMPLNNSVAECFYSIAEQTKPVDVVIFTHGLTPEQVATLRGIAESPYFTLTKTN